MSKKKHKTEFQKYKSHFAKLDNILKKNKKPSSVLFIRKDEGES